MPREPISKDIMHFEPPYTTSIGNIQIVSSRLGRNYHQSVHNVLVCPNDFFWAGRNCNQTKDGYLLQK